MWQRYQHVRGWLTTWCRTYASLAAVPAKSSSTAPAELQSVQPPCQESTLTCAHLLGPGVRVAREGVARVGVALERIARGAEQAAGAQEVGVHAAALQGVLRLRLQALRQAGGEQAEIVRRLLHAQGSRQLAARQALLV